MAYDYALVHLIFTIPLAALLTLLAYPFLSRTHIYKISILVCIAVVSTIPWDAYLIRNNIWTYPTDAIIGPRLSEIPAEEVFFFVIQTYITSLLYLLFQKPLLHVTYLEKDVQQGVKRLQWLVQGLLLMLVGIGVWCVWLGGRFTYIGLILAWAAPFLLLSWTFGGTFILRLPTWSIALPIFLPTLYLWVVDELALAKGTWAIAQGTKLDIRVWGSLDIEEAIFFLATNVLIVVGLAALDHGLAIIEAFPSRFPQVPVYPSPLLLVKAFMTQLEDHDMGRIAGIREAAARLRRKSRSFQLASSAFNGRLRIDLTLLYSFCRMADDLIDNAETASDQARWLQKLRGFLDLSCSSPQEPPNSPNVRALIEKHFPRSMWSALSLLPTEKLLKQPLYRLLEGFQIDVEADRNKQSRFPIKDEDSLDAYATCVASTIGELCIFLIFNHGEDHRGCTMAEEEKTCLHQAARTMGIALQCVNIARDIQVDAAIGRVYIPTTWLEEEGLSHGDVIGHPKGPLIDKLRLRLLNKAFGLYREARPAMDRIPQEARAPMIAAVESYMEIARVIVESENYVIKNGKATVPRTRRVWVLFKSLLCG